MVELGYSALDDKAFIIWATNLHAPFFTLRRTFADAAVNFNFYASETLTGLLTIIIFCNVLIKWTLISLSQLLINGNIFFESKVRSPSLLSLHLGYFSSLVWSKRKCERISINLRDWDCYLLEMVGVDVLLII